MQHATKSVKKLSPFKGPLTTPSKIVTSTLCSACHNNLCYVNLEQKRNRLGAISPRDTYATFQNLRLLYLHNPPPNADRRPTSTPTAKIPTPVPPIPLLICPAFPQKSPLFPTSSCLLRRGMWVVASLSVPSAPTPPRPPAPRRKVQCRRGIPRVGWAHARASSVFLTAAFAGARASSPLF